MDIAHRPATYADVDELINDMSFNSNTPIVKGVRRLIDRYREYYWNS